MFQVWNQVTKLILVVLSTKSRHAGKPAAIHCVQEIYAFLASIEFANALLAAFKIEYWWWSCSLNPFGHALLLLLLHKPQLNLTGSRLSAKHQCDSVLQPDQLLLLFCGMSSEILCGEWSHHFQHNWGRQVDASTAGQRGRERKMKRGRGTERERDGSQWSNSNP